MLEKRKETGEVAPSTNPEARPDLQDYKDKESANTNTCQDCIASITRTTKIQTIV